MRRHLEQRELEALRGAAIEATAPAEPDWSRLDRVIDSAAREAAARPAPRRSAVTAWATAAAAACVAIATWLLLDGGEHRGPAGDPRPAMARTDGVPAPAPAPRTVRGLLTLSATDSLDIRPPPASAPMEEGASITVPAPGELRLALGPSGLVELGPGTAAQVLSLDEHTATLSVESGTLLVDVPPGALVRDLTVVAERTAFQLLCGTAEFSVRDGVLEVRVIDGEIEVFDGERPARLVGGSFRRQPDDAGAPIVRWSPMPPAPGDLAERASIAERPLGEPAGTLPRRVVRAALDRVTPRIRACYENTLKRHPRAAASVTARLRVDIGGAVSVTSLSGAGSWPGLDECLRDALGAMSYPPPLGGPVDLILPLRLVPETRPSI
jgi:hypothetical protein